VTVWPNPLKITQKSSKTPFWPKIFLACGALKGASPYGTVLVSPKSATLTVTIIPVTLAVGVGTRGVNWARSGGPGRSRGG
jgi:hypothetical protein